MIDTTKLDSGNFIYRPQNGDIVSFIENICTSVTEYIVSKNMRIIFDTNKEEKIIAFDSENLERIILNLLSNAIKYSNKDGVIKVNVNCSNTIDISVVDNGVGIPSDKLNTIFGKFAQAKCKFKTEKEGSGIGLSLVKSLVEIHNGTIKVISTQGKGSEFIVSLPDRLVENTEEKYTLSNQYINNTNRMSVEFADIYS